MSSELARIARLEQRVAKLEEIVTTLAAERGIHLDLEAASEEVVDAEIAHLLERGRKIQAVKAYRDRTGAGLKEAKDYIDDVEARLKRGY